MTQCNDSCIFENGYANCVGKYIIEAWLMLDVRISLNQLEIVIITHLKITALAAKTSILFTYSRILENKSCKQKPQPLLLTKGVFSLVT